MKVKRHCRSKIILVTTYLAHMERAEFHSCMNNVHEPIECIHVDAFKMYCVPFEAFSERGSDSRAPSLRHALQRKDLRDTEKAMRDALDVGREHACAVELATLWWVHTTTKRISRTITYSHSSLPQRSISYLSYIPQEATEFTRENLLFLEPCCPYFQGK